MKSISSQSHHRMIYEPIIKQRKKPQSIINEQSNHFIIHPYYNLVNIQTSQLNQHKSITELNNNKEQQQSISKFDQLLYQNSQIKNILQKISHKEKVQDLKYSFQTKNCIGLYYNNKFYVFGAIGKGKINQTTNKSSDSNASQLITKLQYMLRNQYANINNINIAQSLAYNIVQVPMFNLVNSKTWLMESFKLKSFQSLCQAYKFINIRREQQFQSALSSYTYLHSQPAITGNKRTLQKDKPILYLPSQLTGMSYCMDGAQTVYLFGGFFQQDQLQYSNKLWKVDLQSKTLQLIQHKGQIPQPRSHSTLIAYNSFWIILYGGYNMINCQVYNEFYVYSIGEKTWYQLTGDYQYLFNARIHYTLTINPATKMMYLFGGLLQDYDGRNVVLGDLYVVNVEELQYGERKQKQGKRVKGSIQLKSILRKQYGSWPQARYNHQSISLNQTFILLIGGQSYNSYNSSYQTINNKLSKLDQTSRSTQISDQLLSSQTLYHNDIWLFNTKTQQWTQILPWNQHMMKNGRSQFCLQFYSIKENSQYEFIVFGGVSANDQSDQCDKNINRICKVVVSLKDYQQQLFKEDNEKRNRKRQVCCQICSKSNDELTIYHNKTHHLKSAQSFNHDTIYNPYQSLFQKPLVTFPSNQIDNYLLSGIPFPFSAFGILTSLSIQKQSNKQSIQYNHHPTTPHLNYILIQDDSYLPFTLQQFIPSLRTFSIHDTLQINGVADKKYKQNQSRQKNIIDFSNNLRIASLRIGQQILWITVNMMNHVIVYMIRKQMNQPMKNKDKKNNNEDEYEDEYIYRQYYYCMQLNNPTQFIGDYSQESRRQILKNHQSTIKQFLKDKRYVGSLIKISKLRYLYEDGGNRMKQLRLELQPRVKENTIVYQVFNHMSNGMKNDNRMIEEKNEDTNTKKNDLYERLRFQQSIDYNLKTYLSMLYLSLPLKILLKVKQNISSSNKQSNNIQNNLTTITSVNTSSMITSQSYNGSSSLVKKITQQMQLHAASIHNSMKSNNLLKISQFQANKAQLNQNSTTTNKNIKGDQKQALNNISAVVIVDQIIINKFEQIYPQFTLSKVDKLLQKSKIIQVQPDVFADFQIKIFQVYYWNVKQLRQECKKNMLLQQQKQHKSQLLNEQNRQLLSTKQIIYPNGLLIYHQNRLIQRYRYSLGTRIPIVTNLNNKLISKYTRSKISSQMCRQQNPLSLSLSQSGQLSQLSTNYLIPKFNLFGVIQIPQKFVLNKFGNGFINQNLLDKLYEKLEHVAYLLDKKSINTQTIIKNPIFNIRQQNNNQLIQTKFQRQFSVINYSHKLNTIQQLVEKQIKDQCKKKIKQVEKLQQESLQILEIQSFQSQQQKQLQYIRKVKEQYHGQKMIISLKEQNNGQRMFVSQKEQNNDQKMVVLQNDQQKIKEKIQQNQNNQL